MRRNPPTSIGVVACGIVLSAGAIAGFTPAGASTPPNALQSAVQNVESATSAAIAQVTQPAAAPGSCRDAGCACRRSRGPRPGRDPATDPWRLDRAAALDLDPDHAVANEIGSTLLPGQNATTGTNTTTQSSPVANVNAPVNACSLSIGLLAGGNSLLDERRSG